jgi:hypothetical protein
MGLADNISELYNELFDEKTKLYAKKICVGLFAGTVACGIAYINLTRTSVADVVSAMKGSPQEAPKEPTFEEILYTQFKQATEQPYAAFPNGKKFTFYDQKTLEEYKELAEKNEIKTLDGHIKLLEELDDAEDKKYRNIITPKEVERKQ